MTAYAIVGVWTAIAAIGGMVAFIEWLDAVRTLRFVKWKQDYQTLVKLAAAHVRRETLRVIMQLINLSIGLLSIANLMTHGDGRPLHVVLIIWIPLGLIVVALILMAQSILDRRDRRRIIPLPVGKSSR